MPHIDPHAWTEGFKDAYASLPTRQKAEIDAFSYAAGRVEGEALRLKHRQEYEQMLFVGRRVRVGAPPEPGMDKTSVECDGATLGLDSCGDLYEKLKFEGGRLENVWHPYDAFNFVVTAWHLYNDWLPKDRTEKPKLTGKKIAREKLPQEMILVLDVLRDIANSSKHLQLDFSSAEKRKVSETHTGVIDNYYSYFFHERMHGVTAEGDYYFSIRKLRNICLAYFGWVFDDVLPASPFPGELLWDIWRCAPKNHVEGAIPPPGAIPGELGDPDFVT